MFGFWNVFCEELSRAELNLHRHVIFFFCGSASLDKRRGTVHDGCHLLFKVEAIDIL